MRFDWQWPAAFVFATVFLALTVLVYFGKVPAVMLTALLAWLIPSPYQRTISVGAGAVLIVILGATTTACSAAQIHTAEAIATDVTTCLVSKQDLPDAEALAVCGVKEVDRLVATRVLHEARAASARSAHRLGCGGAS